MMTFYENITASKKKPKKESESIQSPALFWPEKQGKKEKNGWLMLLDYLHCPLHDWATEMKLKCVLNWIFQESPVKTTTVIKNN